MRPNVLYTEPLYSSRRDSTARTSSIVASRRIRISTVLIHRVVPSGDGRGGGSEIIWMRDGCLVDMRGGGVVAT